MAGTREPPLAVQNQPPVEPVTEVEKPSKNYWKMATGVLILLLVLCGIALGYLLMKKPAEYPNVQTTNPTVQPTLTPTTAITDETANWKTYNYPFFSLKLPNDWKVYNESNPTQFANYNLNSAPGRDYSPQLDKGKLKAEIYESATGDTLRHYVDLHKQQSSSWLETETKVSGLPAVRVKTSTPGFVVYTQSATSEKIISIVFALDFDNHQDLANQILSTFKFVEQASTLKISTYNFGTFSFSYPNSWKLSENTTDPSFFDQNKISGFDHMVLLQNGDYYLLIGIDTPKSGTEVGGIFTSDADYQSYLDAHDQITIQGEKFFLWKSHTSLVDWNKPNREAGIFGLASFSKYILNKVTNNNQGKSFNGYDDYFQENGKNYMFIKLSKTGSGAILTPATIQTEIINILESIKW